MDEIAAMDAESAEVFRNIVDWRRQGRVGDIVQGAGKARGGGHRPDPRPGQPTAHLRELELDGQGIESGGPYPQFHPDGVRAGAANETLRAVLATHGARLRAGSLRYALRLPRSRRR